MKIVELSVKHYQFTVLMFAMLVVLGVTSWLSIPRGEDPTFPAPTYTIVAVYPGASPTDIEQLVVDKIEERVKELEDLKEMKSTVRDGLATVRVEFDPSVDAEQPKSGHKAGNRPEEGALAVRFKGIPEERAEASWNA